MKGRLGVYDKKPFDPEVNQIDGLYHQYTHATANGGNLQQERMIKDKRRSLDRAVWYSYQAAEIKKVDAADGTPARALINPNKLKPDYDDKVLSIGFEYNIKCGDVFEWVGTNTHWIVYLQDITELAYFRGDIRKCTYEIAWEDENGKHTTYAAIKGPAETKILSTIYRTGSADLPNYSLSLVMPANEDTLKYFTRYSKFYLKNYSTCWRVEAVDSFSVPGVLEVHATEYYSNTMEDDVKEGIVGGLIVEPENPNSIEEEYKIKGETFIKVKKTYLYAFNGAISDYWKVDSKFPVELTPDPHDPRKVSVKWTQSFSGQFELYYGDNYHKTIIVESLF